MRKGIKAGSKLKECFMKGLLGFLLFSMIIAPTIGLASIGAAGHNQYTTTSTIVLGKTRTTDGSALAASSPEDARSGIVAGVTPPNGKNTALATTEAILPASPVLYGSSGTAKPLTNGITMSGQLTGAGDSQMWYINASSGIRYMHAVLSTLSGNYFYVYGRYNSTPNTSTHDWAAGSLGYVVVDYYTNQAGKWYIMVYSSGGKGSYLLTMTLLYTDKVKTLLSGVPAIGRLNATADSALWCLNVTQGAGMMRCTLTCPANADFDVYGNPNYSPTLDSYWWAGANPGSESVTFISPPSASWYIMPFSYFGNGTYQLNVTVTYTPIPQYMSSGQMVSGHLNGSGHYDMWYLYVSGSAVNMHSVLTCPANANFNLYGQWGSVPTTSSYTWCGQTAGGVDLNYYSPGSGTWYIMVYCQSGNATYQLTVTVTYTSTPMYINSGVTVYGSLSDTGASDSYTMYVSYNAASMSCYLTTGLGGYLVVYGQYGSAPTTTTYYWDAMENGGSIATSTYSNPMEGNWYFMVYSQSGGISYQLTITITYNTGSGGGGGIDMSGAIVPILASFILLFIFVIILASSRVSTSRPGSRSSYRPYQTPSDASSTIERQAQVVAPRLVQCKRCGASMKQGEDYCWNCGTPTRPGSATSRTPSPQTAKPVRSGVCMVCKRGLEKTDEILFCPYCGSLAHKDDLLEWLHVKDYCPTCGRHLDENEVKRQADPQSRPRNRGTQS